MRTKERTWLTCCCRSSGLVFDVPHTDILIPMPSIGDVVSFSYDAHSRRDIPVNPKIFKVRTDISWEEVVQAEHEAKQYAGLPTFSFSH